MFIYYNFWWFIKQKFMKEVKVCIDHISLGNFGY